MEWSLQRKFVDLLRVWSLHIIYTNHPNTFLLINFVTTYSKSLIFRKSLVGEGQNGNSKTLCFTSKRKKHHFQYASLQSSLSFFSRVYYYYFHSERCIAFHKMPSVVRQSTNFIFTIYPSNWMNFLFFFNDSNMAHYSSFNLCPVKVLIEWTISFNDFLLVIMGRIEFSCSNIIFHF